VEFALVLPILVLLVFGVIEFGSVYNAQVMITGAAREAAREMAVEGDAAAAVAVALDAAPGLAPALAVADVSVPTSCPAGEDVTITIEYEKPFLTGIFGAAIELAGVATRRCQG
jgi:Flp pilus assembly protein TadG